MNLKKKLNLTLIIALVIVTLISCNRKETKTLYGTWEPYAFYNNSVNSWDTTSRPFFISITGKCEDLTVEKNIYGDIAAPAVPFSNSKCSGERNEVNFEDTTDGGDTYKVLYHFVMDKSKDTLNGTRTVQYKDNAMVEKWIYVRGK